MTNHSANEGVRLQEYAFIGQDISHAIKKAVEVARLLDAPVAFGFNGVDVTVRRDSDPNLIYRDWHRALNDYIGKEVGPYPAAVLTQAELASDASIEAEHEARRKIAAEAYERRSTEKKAVLAAALADCPPMARDEAEWAKGIEAQKGSGYGLATFGFAETWARLMQKRIEAGENLADIADECCTLADAEYGITGFMYGCAVSILGQLWPYGDALRRWHNSKYGRGEAEGTVNPALLTINTGASR